MKINTYEDFIAVVEELSKKVEKLENDVRAIKSDLKIENKQLKQDLSGKASTGDTWIMPN